MAQWMIGRLTERLTEHVEAGNVQKVKVYVERRQIKNCQQDPMQRPNALYMMNSILDSSDDESDAREARNSASSGSSTVQSPSV
jgi:hypothetical protein